MMMRSLAFACAALAALCSYADGTIELHDGGADGTTPDGLMLIVK